MAIDRAFIAQSTPIWVDAKAPNVGKPGTSPWRQLLVAQDTGGGILGAVRGDIYWGDDATAESVGRHALQLASELGMRPLAAHCHAALTALYAHVHERARAEEHAAAATALYNEMQMPYWQSVMERELVAAASRPA